MFGRQVLGAGEQQPAVHPDRVTGGAVAAEEVAGDALPDLGDHLVGQGDQVPAVNRDQRLRQRSTDA